MLSVLADVIPWTYCVIRVHSHVADTHVAVVSSRFFNVYITYKGLRYSIRLDHQ